jgi:hypothetical protein
MHKRIRKANCLVVKACGAHFPRFPFVFIKMAILIYDVQVCVTIELMEILVDYHALMMCWIRRSVLFTSAGAWRDPSGSTKDVQ